MAPKDPGARDPDVRGAAIDRVNRFAVPESIGTHYPDLPFGHSIFNKDLVPKDVIDRGAATSAHLNHMKRECKPCVTLALEIGGGLFFSQDFWDLKKDRCGYHMTQIYFGFTCITSKPQVNKTNIFLRLIIS